MELKFYICRICGNIIVHVKDSGVRVVCCDEEMQELVPNTTDASVEKHVPAIHVSGGLVTVDVGSAPHPMTDAHFIEWVCIETEQGWQRKALKPGDAPRAAFALTDGDAVKAAFAYCNLHSLWKAEA